MAAPVSDSIDQRFAQLIQQFGLTKNSFALSLGRTASVVQHLIDGRNKPGYDLLCKVFDIYPNVSRDWLLLGRGPMLVSGEASLRAPAPVVFDVPELPLEPIDVSEIEVPPTRRAGARLQPDEIAATLALAAAVNQPARTAAPAPAPIFVAPEVPVSPPTMPEQSAPLFAAPVTPVPPVTPAPVAAPAPELYVAAALHAQHLQHQLAVAEMRNQHLLDQQQMLREMLAMARQAAG